MVCLRIFKRNRLSFIRAIVVLVCICVVILMLKNHGNTAKMEEIDISNMMSSKSNQETLVTEETIKENDVIPKKETLTVNEVQLIESNALRPIKIEKLDSYSSLAELRETIKRLNEEQRILNLDKFPKRSKHSIVIVVQVHKRKAYLTKLIESLRKSQGISDALLVISHDYYATDINNVVQEIDFCQVLQIFFPYSPQLNPDKFPGTDPNDCPRDTPKSRARAIGCLNAEHPDMYGHYREVQFTMTKHHWWWKANRVFRDLKSTNNHQGLVLLLEEDHYVSPDFYEVLKKAYHLKKSDTRCREYGCDIITLGDYKPISSFGDVGSNLLHIQPWRSTENNMGMAFDRTTWTKISECSKAFCTYDDYNWDWTLMRMSLQCLQKQLTVLLFAAPRVFHLGTCGMHHQHKNCNIDNIVSQTQSIIEKSEGALNPGSFEIEISHPWIQGHFGQANGGWGDIRDHQLCLNFTKSTN